MFARAFFLCGSVVFSHLNSSNLNRNIDKNLDNFYFGGIFLFMEMIVLNTIVLVCVIIDTIESCKIGPKKNENGA